MEQEQQETELNTQRYKAYIKWLSLPKEQRSPTDIDSFMAKIGATKQEIMSFQDYPSFGDDLEAEAIKWGKRKIPEMVHLLYNAYIKNPQKSEYLRLFKELITESNKEKSKDPTFNQYNLILDNVPEDRKNEIAERFARRVNLLPGGSQE